MHCIPIYLADITVKIVKVTKNRTSIETAHFVLEKQVVKGFHEKNIIAFSKKNILKNAAEFQSLTKSKEVEYSYKISDIVLLKQIGLGINDLDVRPV